MAYADSIRSATCTMSDVASLIEGLFVSGYQLTWSTWTPTLGAGGSMTFTGTSARQAQYIQVGKLVFVLLDVLGTTGGTASNSITATLPVTAANAYGGGGFSIVDNGTTYGATVNLSTTVATIRKYDSGNYTLGANREIKGFFFYEAA